MDVLTIQGLKKAYGKQQVLNGVDLRVAPHCIYGFIGQNGAGKTTTMKAILGLHTFDEGKILIEGEAVVFGKGKTNAYVGYVNDVPEGDINALVEEYYSKYDIILEGRDPEEFKRHVAVQAQIEIGFEKFLEEKNYQAIVTHFGDLGALKQLPGLAIQRLMEKGYGFGAEGDWKTAAMVRLMKIMTAGVKDAKGTSMMEDYTYNFVPGKEGILQSHMLEVCPSVADGKIGIKVCPLSMGDREDPARLVFTSKTGPAIATSLIDLGDRFRLIINDVECKKVEKPMPKLPVGSAFWTPQPNLKTGAEAWILAGGAHHTAFSYDLTAEQMGDWAAAMGIEAVYIDKDTNIRDFKNELRWNELAFRK